MLLVRIIWNNLSSNRDKLIEIKLYQRLYNLKTSKVSFLRENNIMKQLSIWVTTSDKMICMLLVRFILNNQTSNRDKIIEKKYYQRLYNLNKLKK